MSCIEGTVVAITPQGDLLTSITAEALRGIPRNEAVTVRCDEHETHGIFEFDHQEPESTFVAVINEEGQLRLEIVGVSAAAMLGIRVGEKVTVQW